MAYSTEPAARGMQLQQWGRRQKEMSLLPFQKCLFQWQPRSQSQWAGHWNRKREKLKMKKCPFRGISTEYRHNYFAKPHSGKCLSAEIAIRVTDCGFAEGPRLTSSWEEDCDRCWRTNKHEGNQTLSIWETFRQPHNESSASLNADPQWSADRQRCHWTVCVPAKLRNRGQNSYV